MHNSFENDATHINLWGAWFPNFPMFFGQPENGDRCALSGFLTLVYLLFVISIV
jgi:hypothetical protein